MIPDQSRLCLLRGSRKLPTTSAVRTAHPRTYTFRAFPEDVLPRLVTYVSRSRDSVVAPYQVKDQWSDDRTGWAKFSDDMLMRYSLARSLTDAGWEWLHAAEAPSRTDARRIVFLMLNPSTADAFVLDPTIKRCMSFAREWRADVLQVVNIFALRSTDPGGLYKLGWGARGDDQANNDQIILACTGAVRVVAGWGKHGALDNRGDVVRSMLAARGVQLWHLGLNKDGSPKHPLYLKGGTEPQEWPAKELAA